jgi:hypothetical protein
MLAIASCSKDDGTGRGEATGELTRDRVIAAWKKGGLEPTPFTAATTTVGKDCQSGTVNSVDVLVCQFATPDEAKAAEPKGYTWVGEATGTAVVTGKVLVVASDRRKSDPSGRTIDKLMKLSK